jgi:predicted TIM-barrel fold metal-dependent hydrolase
MIDFHCHITTPGSRMPAEDGEYYQSIKPAVQAGEWANFVWQETIEAMAETLRTPAMLKGYRQMAPLIYSEMSRRMLLTDADRILVEMAKNDIRQAVVVAMDPYVPTDELLAACVRTKDILIPFGSVDPWAEDWREKLHHTLRLPIAGFKFHFALQQLPFASERMRGIVSMIAELRPSLPIYMHAGEFPIYKPLDEDWAVAMDRFLDEFPTLTFICGHCGWNEPSAALRAARRHENLWLETSWQPPQVLKRLNQALGPRRLLMGSDYPLFSMRRAVRNCRLAFTPEEFSLVSETNAKELIAQGRQGYAAIADDTGSV